MKKLFLSLFGLFCVSCSFAYWETVEIYSSSFTQTTEGPSIIPNTPPGTIFAGIVVGTATTAAGVKIYDSSGVASRQIGEVNCQSGQGSYYYNIYLSSGLTYTTIGAPKAMTIIFKRVR